MTDTQYEIRVSRPCEPCEGGGYVPFARSTLSTTGETRYSEPCPNCNDTGRVDAGSEPPYALNVPTLDAARELARRLVVSAEDEAGEDWNPELQYAALELPESGGSIDLPDGTTRIDVRPVS